MYVEALGEAAKSHQGELDQNIRKNLELLEQQQQQQKQDQNKDQKKTKTAKIKIRKTVRMK